MNKTRGSQTVTTSQKVSINSQVRVKGHGVKQKKILSVGVLGLRSTPGVRCSSVLCGQRREVSLLGWRASAGHRRLEVLPEYSGASASWGAILTGTFGDLETPPHGCPGSPSSILSTLSWGQRGRKGTGRLFCISSTVTWWSSNSSTRSCTCLIK